MYKITIDKEVVFQTDDKYAFINYCMSHAMITMLILSFLPDSYNLEMATK